MSKQKYIPLTETVESLWLFDRRQGIRLSYRQAQLICEWHEREAAAKDEKPATPSPPPSWDEFDREEAEAEAKRLSANAADKKVDRP